MRLPAEMKGSLMRLWRHSDFLKLWTGQTISSIGSHITFLALPLTAVLILEATPTQMGLLSSIEALPALLVGLFVGVWVDRRRRRPIMIAANIGRAVLLMAIPLAALTGNLRIEYLYVLGFLTGALGLFFSVASQSFLVTLVGKPQLVEANSKLEISRSAAEIVGPGLAGALIQILTAPVAIAFDALSFVISGLLLVWIRTPEPEMADHETQNPILREARDGLRVVADDHVLRALAGCLGTIGVFNAMLEAVWILYITRELHLEPGMIGVIFGGGSIGFLIGAVAAGRVTRWIGYGPAIMLGVVVTFTSDLVTPLASGTPLVVMIMLLIASFFFSIGLTLFNIGQVSLRQTMTPVRWQGRMNATMEMIGAGVIPLGALLGGVLGEAIGLRATLFLAVAGELSACLWLFFSPVRVLRTLPDAVE